AKAPGSSVTGPSKVIVRLVTRERWAEPSLTTRLSTRAGAGTRKLLTTYSPNALPADSPSMLSNDQWMPPSRRLRAFSLAASEKLANERVTPGRKSEVEEKAIASVPKQLASVTEAAARNVLCPDE